MTIDQIVEDAISQASTQMQFGKLNLRSIIYNAVNLGMADAYERGVESVEYQTEGELRDYNDRMEG
jgi:hypothetical protein